MRLHILAFLLIITTAMPLGTSDFYTKFISMDEDLTHAEMTYELCNPLKEELYLLKAFGSDYYAKEGASDIPELKGETYYIQDVRATYSPRITNGVVEREATGTEEFFRLTNEKDFLKPGQCAVMMTKSLSEPRYMKEPVDVVPTLDLVKAGISEEEIISAKLPESASMVEWKEREWWNITFLNRTRLYVNNSNTYSFSAYPVEINATLVEADADGHDIRVACDDALTEFGAKAYGSQKFGIRFRAKLGVNMVNGSCYAYYNPTKTVKDVRSGWNGMYWNLWFNATENYWDWQDMMQNEVNWYATVAPVGIGSGLAGGQFAITSPTNTRPNPTFTGVNVPNRALIRAWTLDNDTSQSSGVFFGEADVSQAPYTCYQVTAQRQTGSTGRIIYREFTTGGAGTIIASNSTSNTFYRGWSRSDIIWSPNSAIYTRTYYLNGTLMQVLNYTDVSVAQGALGFNEEAAAYYHALGYRQYARSGIRAYASGNDSYTPEVPVNGTADPQNIDVDWGSPTQTYCVNGATLREFWSVTINGDVYQKTKDITCAEGCANNRCAYAQDMFWYALLAVMLLIFAFLMLKGRR